MRTMHIGRRGRAVLAAVSLLAGMADIARATGLASAAPAFAAVSAKSAVQSTAKKATPPHVMTIMMENTDYSQFVGSPAMPYLNEIGNEYATFTHADGWTYPSLPNYLELLLGSDDGTAGRTATSRRRAATTSRTRHWSPAGDGRDLLERVLPGATPRAAIRATAAGTTRTGTTHSVTSRTSASSARTSPTSLICCRTCPRRRRRTSSGSCRTWSNSGGDNGTMSSGDSWLSGELPKIMDTSWYRQGGQIVILYDTGYNDTNDSVDDSTGGQIPMVVVSAHTKGMGAIYTPVNTAGVLRSVEHAYGLPHIGNAVNAKNGTLGNALISSRPVSSRPAAPVSAGRGP